MILLLSTSDTDLLSARASRRRLAPRQPATASTTCPACSPRPTSSSSASSAAAAYWEDGIDAVLAAGLPVVALGGEQAPDAELMELSTVPAGVAAAGAHLPRAGRPGEPRAAARVPVRHRPAHRRGLRAAGRAAELGRRSSAPRGATDGPTVAVLYYRAQQLAGNTAFVEALCAAIEDAGGAPAAGVLRLAARRPSPRCCDTLRAADALVVTVLAAGGTKPAAASAGRRRRGLGRRRARRPRRPDPAGPLPDQQPRRLGGQRRRAVPARRRDPGRGARVRRPADHRAVLVQGVRRRRAAGLRRRPRARRPRRRHRGAARPAAAHPERATSGSC